VRQFPMRVKCATLAWRAMRQSIASAQETTP
jgi:NifU-like protein involved in Fe-S cluster formation